MIILLLTLHEGKIGFFFQYYGKIDILRTVCRTKHHASGKSIIYLKI